ncbi:carbohydrate kinase [Maribius pontilimi]|uniref:Carbohydrate kinase n=1 Tax=Palleronia pontilimi TaxID=1964209 RepID=A0A934IFZ6_9RHOB|nr:carbohydrate kinase [Palleronia pontilimi]MBJ3761159.1 carbohydrate kinase [Palleronia pontilimi]
MILCCGEALIDMLPRETRAGEPAFAPYAGGAVFNTAIASARLGVETGFFSGLSWDLFGKKLVDVLQADGVDVSAAARSHRPTTLAFVTLVDGHATYAFYDENTAGRMLSEDDLPGTIQAEALFFGGISLVVEPCANTYEALAQREAAQRVVMIDPNIRPSFITDEPAYRARLDRMLGIADIVKLSDDDLHWLRGDGDIAALAQGILKQGAKLVCITEGAKGVTGYSARGAVSVPAETVEVVDTVGAGDTFNAGCLAALARAGLLSKAAVADLSDGAIREALTLGAKAAAVTVSRAGANPPTAAELGL